MGAVLCFDVRGYHVRGADGHGLAHSITLVAKASRSRQTCWHASVASKGKDSTSLVRLRSGQCRKWVNRRRRPQTGLSLLAPKSGPEVKCTSIGGLSILGIPVIPVRR